MTASYHLPVNGTGLPRADTSPLGQQQCTNDNEGFVTPHFRQDKKKKCVN